MDKEKVIDLLRQRIGELEARQDEHEDGSLDWETLEEEMCRLETALIRLHRGVEIGLYQVEVDKVVSDSLGV